MIRSDQKSASSIPVQWILNSVLVTSLNKVARHNICVIHFTGMQYEMMNSDA
jgi:hypothetical protein